jgi:hypothetical protein
MSERMVYLSDNIIELRGLYDETEAEYVSDATVEVTLTDLKTDVAITGETWPLTMAYVTASDGYYRATLVDSLGVTKGQALRATVEAVKGDANRVFTEVVWVREGR